MYAETKLKQVQLKTILQLKSATNATHSTQETKKFLTLKVELKDSEKDTKRNNRTKNIEKTTIKGRLFCIKTDIKICNNFLL